MDEEGGFRESTLKASVSCLNYIQIGVETKASVVDYGEALRVDDDGRWVMMMAKHFLTIIQEGRPKMMSFMSMMERILV